MPARGEIDQAFQQIVRLRFAGAAIGVNRHRVGEGGAYVHGDGGDDITAAHRVGRRVGGTAGSSARHVSAEIGDRGNIQRQKASVRGQRQTGGGDVVAALRGADEILAAVFDPFDRAAKLSGGPQQHHPLGVQRVLDAETAADIGGGDQHALGRQAEHAGGELIADGVHAGGGDQQMERIVLEAADRGTGFGGSDNQAVVDQVKLFDKRGARHRGVDGGRVALLEAERLVAGDLVPQQRRAWRKSGGGIDHGRQRAVFDDNGFRGVAGRVCCFSDDESHGIAHVANAAIRQRGSGRNQHRTRGRDGRRAGQQTEISDVGVREHRRSSHRAAVDALDHRVRVRRSHDMGEKLAGKIDVFNEDSAAGEETFVLNPARGLSDEGHG